MKSLAQVRQASILTGFYMREWYNLKVTCRCFAVELGKTPTEGL